MQSCPCAREAENPYKWEVSLTFYLLGPVCCFPSGTIFLFIMSIKCSDRVGGN